MSKKLLVLLCVLCLMFLSIAGYSGYRIYVIQKGYNEAKDAYTAIQVEYKKEIPVPETMDSKEPQECSPIHIDFKGLQENVNPEIIAYIWCPETIIDYPVVQHENNDYYLDHNANGEYNLNGAIFVDSSNFDNFSDRNTVLHGHHMNDGSMFASLSKWYDEEYLNEHPVMYLNTAVNGNFRIDLFAAFTTPAESAAYKYEFSGENEVQEWLNWLADNSMIHPDIEVTPKDHIITMSTCAYSFEGARTVVCGKLVPIG